MPQNAGNDMKLLEVIYEGAQMGRDSIMQLVKASDDAEFRRALEVQQTEYQKIMDDAEGQIRALGAEPEGLGLIAKVSSGVMSAVKTLADDSVANMAEMMIQGSTMGVTKIKRRRGELEEVGEGADRLADRLLRTEESNIESMKNFL